MDDFENRLDFLQKQIMDRIQHPFIEEYVENPLIDQVKLALTASIFDHAPVKESFRHDYIISTMLVQIASDTHELVPSFSLDETPQEEKEKQLLVLAGDYYSGLHYLLLTKTADFPFIQLIAQTIKRINELKTELYYEDQLGFFDFLEKQREIHALITEAILEHYTDYSFDSSIGDIILVHLLLQEKELLTTAGEVKLLNKICHDYNQQQLLEKINEAIHIYISQLDQNFKNPKLEKAFADLKFDQLFQRLKHKYFSLVEEGS